MLAALDPPERRPDRSRRLARSVGVPLWAHRSAEYYGATRGLDLGLHWREEGHDLTAQERAPLGLGEHVLPEERAYRWLLRLQLWKRPGSV